MSLSLQQAHTQEPLAQSGLTDKLISEHPAARRDAFNQRPPSQPPPLQSKFFLWPAPSGKAGDGKPADFSSVVRQGSALCLPRRDASVEITRLCIPVPLVTSHSAWFLPSHFILTVTGLETDYTPAGSQSHFHKRLEETSGQKSFNNSAAKI